MHDFITSGKKVLEIEAQSISSLANRLDQTFVAACEAIIKCTGRVIVIGIGKSGHIARKIAATLASTGTPAFFVHPAEAAHGDLGMITKDDLIICLSKSGETDEIIALLPMFKRLGITVIHITGNTDSTIGRACDINLDAQVEREACALNLAPTASSTLALAMGDALAVSVLEARGFTADDFALAHPGGLLGRRLLVKVSDVMHSGDALPKVFADTKLTEAIIEMTNKRLGMTTVVMRDAPDTLLGLFTDGDLRRLFNQHANIKDISMQEVMIRNPKHIRQDMLATESVLLMQQHKINALPVLDNDDKLVGALNIHDIFKAGVV